MTTPHEDLFADFVSDLREAKSASQEWWEKLVKKEMENTRNRNRAISDIRRRWPTGACAHPYVIAVVRNYFLACEALNVELSKSGREDEEVYPHDFVSEWLLDEETEDLADFVSELSYWPIGLDSDGDFA